MSAAWSVAQKVDSWFCLVESDMSPSLYMDLLYSASYLGWIRFIRDGIWNTSVQGIETGNVTFVQTSDNTLKSQCLPSRRIYSKPLSSPEEAVPREFYPKVNCRWSLHWTVVQSFSLYPTIPRAYQRGRAWLGDGSEVGAWALATLYSWLGSATLFPGLSQYKLNNTKLSCTLTGFSLRKTIHLRIAKSRVNLNMYTHVYIWRHTYTFNLHTHMQIYIHAYL